MCFGLLSSLILQKREIERKKQHREMIKREISKFTVRGRGGGGPGRYWNSRNDLPYDYIELHRQEKLEMAHLGQLQWVCGVCVCVCLQNVYLE